jgi:hypothetical protein
MDDKDIKTLIKVLEHKGETNLSLLLKGCQNEIDFSGQWGTKWKSILATFIIYAPIEQYFKLKKLSKKEEKIIIDSILDVYPVVDNGPEINSVDFRIVKEDQSEYENRELSSYVGRTVRVFMSYTTEDKELAGGFKKSLENVGLEVFLAHEDINASSDWPKTILENLKSTDIFMPLITENFHNSFWTDQESGVALSENKLIFPIAIDGRMPYGFLGGIQAFKHNSQYPISAGKIVEAIIQGKPEFTGPLLDSIIKSFSLSHSFDDAGLKSDLLLKFSRFTAEQINEIFRGVAQNEQIYGVTQEGQFYYSSTAHVNIKKLYEKYSNLLDKKLLEELKSKNELNDITS